MNNQKRNLKVSAPGKIILSGEHAVVHGYPALLTAVNLRLSIKNEVIHSDIPVGGGMGSSAAYAVAKSAYKQAEKGEVWDLEKINKEAYEIEKRQHGNPSGGDNTVSTYGGFLWYRKESENLKVFTKLKTPKSMPRFLIINTGKPNESTGEMIAFVKTRLQAKKREIESTFRNIEQVTKSLLEYLVEGKNYDLKELIKENEELLEDLGVVSKKAKEIIKLVEGAGGGAKVSGAGGIKDGSGVILAYHANMDKLIKVSRAKKLNTFSVKLGQEGVRLERV